MHNEIPLGSVSQIAVCYINILVKCNKNNNRKNKQTLMQKHLILVDLTPSVYVSRLSGGGELRLLGYKFFTLIIQPM